MTAPVGSTNSSQSISSAISSTTGAGGPMGKDQFVKLLVAQMTHQDPLNPMDSSQMAAQLAQFSSVEQLMNINSKLGMIGRSVTAVSDQISVSGHAAPNIQADVPNAGAHVRVHIVDATGQEIGSADYGELAGGRQSLDLSKALKTVPNGSFTVKVETVDSSGAVTALSPIQQFKIDGLKFGTNGAILTSGTSTVPIGNVIGVASN